jgi:GC-rich sequence DNA-binding factor-like protein
MIVITRYSVMYSTVYATIVARSKPLQCDTSSSTAYLVQMLYACGSYRHNASVTYINFNMHYALLLSSTLYRCHSAHCCTRLMSLLRACCSQTSVQVHDSGSTAAAVALVAALQPVLSPAAMTTLIAQSILPKLQRGIAQWSPREQGLPLHNWLLPWCHVSLLKSVLPQLYPELRRKLSAALKHWRPQDDAAATVNRASGSVGVAVSVVSAAAGSGSEKCTAYEAMVAWSSVFDARSYEALLSTRLVLAVCLSNCEQVMFSLLCTCTMGLRVVCMMQRCCTACAVRCIEFDHTRVVLNSM